MDEVTGPVIAVALVLCAVFVPCTFLGGVSGQFFRQFAVTIAVSTVISAFNSLTLSPALAALLLKPHGAKQDFLTRGINFAFGWFFKSFNWFFKTSTNAYTAVVGLLLRLSVISLVVYGGLLVLTYVEFVRAPTGFIPEQDAGYLMLSIQLPDGASVQRTEAVMAEIDKIAHDTPGVANTVGISGQSLILNANASNLGSMYVILDDFDKRTGSSMTASAIGTLITNRCQEDNKIGAVVTAFGAPPIAGLGTTGGFKLVVEDRGGLGLDELQKVSDDLVKDGNDSKELAGLFNGNRNDTPWVFLDFDRTKCAALGVSVADVFNTLQVYVGSYYVNNFNEFGRTWQVNLQADQRFRELIPDLMRLQVRNNQGRMVRLATLMTVRNSSGPLAVMRYNMYPATAITGNPAPGVSSGQAIEKMKELAKQLPESMATEWTELTYLQLLASNEAIFVFALSVVFVFLVLAAQYESWSLPLAVILVVPMCLLCSIVGVRMAGLEVNLFTQIGFVVLVGLASKNAILIVEFAKQQHESGVPVREATLEACRLRLRPILMTSFAFILGVVPLVIATGAGAEMRRALGVAVFGGMLGVTMFGIFLTPIFFYVIGWFSKTPTKPSPDASTSPASPDNGKHAHDHALTVIQHGAAR